METEGDSISGPLASSPEKDSEGGPGGQIEDSSDEATAKRAIRESGESEITILCPMQGLVWQGQVTSSGVHGKHCKLTVKLGPL